MNTELFKMIHALIEGDEDNAAMYLRVVMENKVRNIINEDHEKYMTSKQMEKHIAMLHDKAEDKDAFLKKLASYSTLDAVSEKDFRKCAEDIADKGKVYMDKAIHDLEKLVGYEFDPSKVEENFGNVITRPVDGAIVNLPKIPNVYTTKYIPKKKKVLPKVKKGRYGTGYAPGAWHGDHDHGSDSGGSDSGMSGGADGGAGGE